MLLTGCAAASERAPAASSVSVASASSASASPVVPGALSTLAERHPSGSVSPTSPSSSSAPKSTPTGTPRSSARQDDAAIAAALSRLTDLGDERYDVDPPSSVAEWRRDDEALVDGLGHADTSPQDCHVPYYRYRTAATADLARGSASSEASGVYLTVWRLSTFAEAERALDAYADVVDRCPEVTVSGGGSSLHETFQRRTWHDESGADAVVVAVSRRTQDGKRDDDDYLQAQARLGEYLVQAEVALTGRVPTDDDLDATAEVLHDLVGAVRELRSAPGDDRYQAA